MLHWALTCRERERQRIESKNPNPRMPLVRYVGGTWRTGGILALSRAFGDAYLKGTGQFEGVSAGSDGYSSGFGVIADPTVNLTQLSSKPTVAYLLQRRHYVLHSLLSHTAACQVGVFMHLYLHACCPFLTCPFARASCSPELIEHSVSVECAFINGQLASESILYAFAGDDTWVIIASDGLFENDVRGGGGGLENQQVVDMCLKSKDSTSAQQLARELVEAAQAAGTTDDVTVACLRIAL